MHLAQAMVQLRRAIACASCVSPNKKREQK